MKTTTTLGILLIASIGINIYFWSKISEQQEALKCLAPEDNSPQMTVTADQFRAFSSEFRDSLRGNDRTTGGIITRSTFDAMLCTPGCNGIEYTLGRDITGRTGPEGDGAFIMINGVQIRYRTGTNDIESVTRLGSTINLPQHWCPPTCTPR